MVSLLSSSTSSALALTPTEKTPGVDVRGISDALDVLPRADFDNVISIC